MAERLARVVGVMRQIQTVELVEVRLVVVESAETELVERPAEMRQTESLTGAVGAVRQVEVVSLVEARPVVAESTEIGPV